MINFKKMSSTITTPKPLRIAIIGGGIGGLCTAIALLKYPHIDVQVYEAAPTFGEIGASLGIAPNAQQALELIAPEARAAYDKHATGNMWPKHAKTLANYIVISLSSPVNLRHTRPNADFSSSGRRRT